MGQVLLSKNFGLSPILQVHDEGFTRFLQTAWEEWALAHPEQNEAISYTWMGRARYGDRIPETIDGKLGYYAFDAGTPITSDTWQVATTSVDVALTAQDFITQREQAAFALSLLYSNGKILVAKNKFLTLMPLITCKDRQEKRSPANQVNLIKIAYQPRNAEISKNENPNFLAVFTAGCDRAGNAVSPFLAL